MKKLIAATAITLLSLPTIATAADWSGKEIRVGVDPTYPPMEYKTPEGELTGFDIDVTNALCAQLKAKCVWVESSWDGIIPGLLARKFDTISSSLMITKKRMETIAFTDKVSNAPSRLVARRDAKLKPTTASLAGKRVGVMQGSTQETFANAVWRPAGVEVVSYQNQGLVYDDLVSGRLDAALQSAVQASYGFLNKPAGKDFAFAGSTLYEPKYFGVGGIGLRKEDIALREALNKALAEILANGTYARINDKYFTFNIYGNN